MKSALMLGVNPNFEREENDFYATDPKAIEIALPLFREIGLCKNVWECACGMGHITKVLVNAGYNVYSSDKINRGFGDVLDFLNCDKPFDGDILTNPPFRYAVDFVKKGLQLVCKSNKVWLFLKIQFLESRLRKDLFKSTPPKYVAVYSERQKCAKDGDFEKYCKNSNTQTYAWFVFEKGFIGNPQILWI